MIRPAYLRLIRTLLMTGLLMLLVCGLTSCGEETTPIPAPLRIASAEAGETIIVEDETIRTTLVIPPGVNVSGIQGQETWIERRRGSPGSGAPRKRCVSYPAPEDSQCHWRRGAGRWALNRIGKY